MHHSTQYAPSNGTSGLRDYTHVHDNQ